MVGFAKIGVRPCIQAQVIRVTRQSMLTKFSCQRSIIENGSRIVNQIQGKLARDRHKSSLLSDYEELVC